MATVTPEEEAKTLKIEKKKLTAEVTRLNGEVSKVPKKEQGKLNSSLKETQAKLAAVMEKINKLPPGLRGDLEESPSNMIIHPNVLLERMSATRMPVPRSLETKKKVSKEPEEAKIPFMPHPNLNVTRDKDLMEQLYPNCFTLHHPNIKISRMPKYKHCAKKAIEKTKESKKVCCKVRKAQTPRADSDTDMGSRSSARSNSSMRKRAHTCSKAKKKCQIVAPCNTCGSERPASTAPSCSSMDEPPPKPCPCPKPSPCSSAKPSPCPSAITCNSCGAKQCPKKKPCPNPCDNPCGPPPKPKKSPCPKPKPACPKPKPSCPAPSPCPSACSSKGPSCPKLACPAPSPCPSAVKCNSCGAKEPPCPKPKPACPAPSPCPSAIKCNSCSAKEPPCPKPKPACPAPSPCPSANTCSACGPPKPPPCPKPCPPPPSPCPSANTCSACGAKEPPKPACPAASPCPSKAPSCPKACPSPKPSCGEPSRDNLRSASVRSAAKKSETTCQSADVCDDCAKSKANAGDGCQSADECEKCSGPKTPSKVSIAKPSDCTNESSESEEEGITTDLCPKTKQPPKGSTAAFKTLHRKPCDKELPKDLECSADPCGALDKLRDKINSNKKCPAPKSSGDEPCDIELSDTDDCDEPADDPCADKCAEEKCENADGSTPFSKKYLKMKYEIEMQNYLIDKIARELKSKKKRSRPESELCPLQNRLNQEVKKLNAMVEFAIAMQRSEKTEKWGPIPVSAVIEDLTGNPKGCGEQKRVKIPTTPSNISNVSGFEELEDIIMNEEKEMCQLQTDLMRKQQQIEQLCSKLKTTEEEMVKIARERNSLKNRVSSRKPSNLKKPNKCNDPCGGKENKDDEVAEKLKTLKSVEKMMGGIVQNIEAVKCKAKKLHEDLNSLKQQSC